MSSNSPSRLYIRAKKIDSHIESVTSSIQRLIFADRQKKEENIKRKKLFFSIVVILLLSVLGAVISNKGKAESVMFYPESCLGGWENVNKAINKPESEEGVDFSDITSAVLPKNSVADIYCGDFKGEIPEDSIPKAVVLRVSWSKDGKKIGTNLIESNNFASSTQEILDTAASSTPVIVSTTTELDNVATTSVVDQIEDLKQEIKEELIEETKKETKEEIINVNQETGNPDAKSVTETVLEKINELVAPQVEDRTQSTKFLENLFSLLRNLFEKAYAEEVVSVETKVEVENTIPQLQTTEDVINTEKQKTEEVQESVATSSDKINNEISLENASSTLDISTSTAIFATTTSTSTEEFSSSTGIMDLVTSSSRIFEIKYTFDGVEWFSLGFVGQNELRNSQFEIPINASSTWGDLSHLQVQIKRLVVTDEVDDIYLDGMVLEVGYLKNVEVKVEGSSDPKKFDIGILEISNIHTSLSNDEGGSYLLIGTSTGGQLVIYDNQKDAIVFSSGVGGENVLINAYNFTVGEYTAIITNREDGCDGVILSVCKADIKTIGNSIFKIMPTKDTPIIYINEGNELEQ